VARLRDFGPRVERVAVARQRADLEATALYRPPEPGEGCLVGQQLRRAAVSVAGVVARTDLDAVEPRLDGPVERGLERLVGEQDGEDAQLHQRPPDPAINATHARTGSFVRGPRPRQSRAWGTLRLLSFRSVDSMSLAPYGCNTREIPKPRARRVRVRGHQHNG